MNLEKLKTDFVNTYSGDENDVHVFFAPGRVNLIGEHTDYNGGYVLPCAINYGTYLLVRLTLRPVLKLRSLNFQETINLNIESEEIKSTQQWTDYPLGVIKEFLDKDLKVTGMELLYAGDIPNGAGLSSSASIEVVTAFAINSLLKFNLDNIELIKLSQHAENVFVGMNCGIMDQFAVTMGSENKAIFLNCEILDYENVPVKLNSYKLVISNTNKRRELAGSKYNERRETCEQALLKLKPFYSLRNLSGLLVGDLEKAEKKLDDFELFNKTKHVVTENERVLASVKCLQEGKLEKFGQLMLESHESLAKEYEVSCNELDVLVKEAMNVEGVLGSRMTGGGFGGCTVSLVPVNKIKKFKEQLGERYQKQTGLKADFYVVEISDGVREVLE